MLSRVFRRHTCSATVAAPAASAAAVPNIGELGNDSCAAIKTAAKIYNGKMNIKKDERIESPVGSKILTASFGFKSKF